MILRRNFLFGLMSVLAAPAIVRATSLMPVNAGLILPTHEIIQPRVRMPGVPRCSHCFGPWGMCPHTGGPMTSAFLDNPKFDDRVFA